jgi:hypothetical protein
MWGIVLTKRNIAHQKAQKGAGGVAPVECLPSKCKALSSNPSTKNTPERDCVGTSNKSKYGWSIIRIGECVKCEELN